MSRSVIMTLTVLLVLSTAAMAQDEVAPDAAGVTAAASCSGVAATPARAPVRGMVRGVVRVATLPVRAVIAVHKNRKAVRMDRRAARQARRAARYGCGG